ncbi:glycoside hydrolase family 3 protein [Tessaracoccus antarcticus]|nr:glycoside hydrolase family 3 N-terminal domain-containing protein [Tessaracoccus antarcticus]
MPVRRLALGTLLVSFEGTNGTGVPYWLLDLLGNGVAGVTIFGRNITPEDPVGNLAGLARGLRHGRPDLLIAIDEEGGDVTRLDAETGSMFLGQGSLGAIDDVDVTRRSSASLAARLATAGVNLNFAPVADVASNVDSPIVGSRSFSADPVRASRHTAAAVMGHLDSGVAPTAKHFPGHGSTADDSHLVVPVVRVDLPTLWSRELQPFQAAIAAGVPVVMTGHLLVPALDPDAPATLSPRIIDGLLRTELGFDGVVVTDGLDMHAISSTVGRPEGVVRALLAGVDLMCIGGDSVTPDVVEDIVSAVEEAVASGRLDVARLMQARDRVEALAARFSHDASVRGLSPEEPMLDMARSSLRLVGDPSMAETSTVVELRNEPSIVAGEVAFGMGRALVARSASTRVVHLQRGMPVPELGQGGLVVSVRDAHLHPWQVEAVASLRRDHPGLVVVDHSGSASAEVLGSRAIVAQDASAIAAVAAADVLLQGAAGSSGGISGGGQV